MGCLRREWERSLAKPPEARSQQSLLLTYRRAWQGLCPPIRRAELPAQQRQPFGGLSTVISYLTKSLGQ